MEGTALRHRYGVVGPREPATVVGGGDIVLAVVDVSRSLPAMWQPTPWVPSRGQHVDLTLGVSGSDLRRLRRAKRSQSGPETSTPRQRPSRRGVGAKQFFLHFRFLMMFNGFNVAERDRRILPLKVSEARPQRSPAQPPGIDRAETRRPPGRQASSPPRRGSGPGWCAQATDGGRRQG